MRPPEVTGRHRSRPAERRSARAVLPGVGLVVSVAAALAGVVAVALAVPSTGDAHRPAESSTAAPAAPTPAPDWQEMVRDLMQRRAVAYARGCPAGLAGVYQSGSMAMAADRALLRSWTARDLRVDNAVVRVAGVRPLHRSPGRVVLRVVHRLGSAVAERSDGARWALPRDRPQAHRVVLVRTAGSWRIATVSG